MMGDLLGYHELFVGRVAYDVIVRFTHLSFFTILHDDPLLSLLATAPLVNIHNAVEHGHL